MVFNLILGLLMPPVGIRLYICATLPRSASKRRWRQFWPSSSAGCPGVAIIAIFLFTRALRLPQLLLICTLTPRIYQGPAAAPDDPAPPPRPLRRPAAPHQACPGPAATPAAIPPECADDPPACGLQDKVDRADRVSNRRFARPPFGRTTNTGITGRGSGAGQRRAARDRRVRRRSPPRRFFLTVASHRRGCGRCSARRWSSPPPNLMPSAGNRPEEPPTVAVAVDRQRGVASQPRKADPGDPVEADHHAAAALFGAGRCRAGSSIASISTLDVEAQHCLEPLRSG